MPSDEEIKFESSHDEPPRSDREAYAQRKSEKQGGMGCLFWGCLIVLLLCFLAVFGSFYATRLFVQSGLREITTDSPMEIGSVEYDGLQMQELRDRIEEYEAAIETGAENPEVDLSGDDLNALMADDKELSEFSEYIYLSIEEGEITGDLSVPLGKLGEAVPPLRMLAGRKFLKDRYFNGSARIQAALNDGDLTIFITSVETDGEDIPAEVMNQIRSEDFAEGLMNNPEFREFMYKIKSFEISEGMVRLGRVPEDLEAPPLLSVPSQSIDSFSTETQSSVSTEDNYETTATEAYPD